MAIKVDWDHKFDARGRSKLRRETVLGIGLALGSGLIIARIPPAYSQSTPLLPTPLSSLSQPLPAPLFQQTPPIEEPIHLVVQRRQRRVEVYQGSNKLAQYPIAVGKPGWETPIGEFQVINKEENPIFKSFKTGNVIMPGPDNPLGVRWIGFWTDGKTQIGFHGTNEPELIGQAVSHGCIRMRNKDVTALYQYVKLGTVVRVRP